MNSQKIDRRPAKKEKTSKKCVTSRAGHAIVRLFVCLFVCFCMRQAYPHVGTGTNNKALSCEHMENV